MYKCVIQLGWKGEYLRPCTGLGANQFFQVRQAATSMSWHLPQMLLRGFPASLSLQQQAITAHATRIRAGNLDYIPKPWINREAVRLKVTMFGATPT